MFEDCEDIGAFFSSSILDRMSVEGFMSSVPDTDFEAYYQCIAGTWSVGPAFQSNQNAVETWLTTNHMSPISLSKMAELIPNMSYNVILTPGEFLLIMVYIHVNCAYDVLYKQNVEDGLEISAECDINASSASIVRTPCLPFVPQVSGEYFKIPHDAIWKARDNVWRSQADGTLGPGLDSGSIQFSGSDSEWEIIAYHTTKIPTGRHGSTNYIGWYGSVGANNTVALSVNIPQEVSSLPARVVLYHSTKEGEENLYGLGLAFYRGSETTPYATAPATFVVEGVSKGLWVHDSTGNWDDDTPTGSIASFFADNDHHTWIDINNNVTSRCRNCSVSVLSSVHCTTNDGYQIIGGYFNNGDTYDSDTLSLSASDQVISVNSATRAIVRGEKVIQPIDWSADSFSQKRIASATGNFSISVTTRTWLKNFTDPNAAAPNNSRYEVVEYIDQVVTTGTSAIVYLTSTDDQIEISTLLMSAISLLDHFNASEIVDASVTARLEDFINSRRAAFDSFMAMYVDYTRFIIAADVVDAMINSIIADEPMATTHGVTDQQTFVINGVTYSAYLVRNSDDDAYVEAFSAFLLSFSDALEYRLKLFDTALNSIDYSDSLSRAIQSLKDGIQERLLRVNTIATLSPSINRALLLTIGKEETIDGSVLNVLSQAASAGFSNVIDAINFSCFLPSSMSYYINDSAMRSFLVDICTVSGYDVDMSCFIQPKEFDDNPGYFESFFSRIGSSIVGESSPDAEYVKTPVGAQYLWPPVMVCNVTSNVNDSILLSGKCFYIPFAHSYLSIRKISGNLFEFAWFARFSGGGDGELVNSVKSSLDEFCSICSQLGHAYSGVDTQMTCGQIADSFGDYETTRAIGTLSATGMGALSGASAGAVAGPYGAAAGALIGALVPLVSGMYESLGYSSLAMSNANVKASAMMDANRDSILTRFKIDSNSTLESEGTEAIRNGVGLILWAIRYGLYKPVGDYVNIDSRSIGVVSPTYVPPKYYFKGETIDYSALVLTASIGVMVSTTAHYLKLEKTRNAVFVPAVITQAAVSTAASALSTIAAEDVATSSELVKMADRIQSSDTGQLITLGDVVAEIQSARSSIINSMPNISTLSSDVSNVKSTVNSIASDLASTTGDVSSISSDINLVKSSLNSLSSDITTLRNTTSNINSSVASVSGKVDGVSNDLSAINSYINSIYTTANSIKSDCGDIITRLTAIKAVVDDIDTSNDLKLTTALANLSSAITIISGISRTVNAVQDILDDDTANLRSIKSDTTEILEKISNSSMSSRKLIRY
jgi:archaellum component FlaC